MTFIFAQQMPSNAALVADGLDDLVGLGCWNTRIVTTGDNKHRFRDFGHAGQR